MLWEEGDEQVAQRVHAGWELAAGVDDCERREEEATPKQAGNDGGASA